MRAIREDKKVPFDWKRLAAFKNLLPHVCKIGNWDRQSVSVALNSTNQPYKVSTSEGEMLSQLKSFTSAS